MTNIRSTALTCVAVCAMATSSGSQAQQVGTYTGTSADGQTVSFTVTQNSKGQLALTSALIYFSAKCKSPNGNLEEGEGVGLDQIIKNSKASWTFKTSETVWFQANFAFVIDKVTGDIETRAAAFVPPTEPPAKSEFCESAKQAFSATFVGGDEAPPVPPGVEVRYPPQ